MAANPRLEFVPTSVLVRFAPGTSEATKSTLRRSVGGTLLKRYKLLPGLELIDSPGGATKAIQKMLKSGEVLYAKPDRIVRLAATPNDPLYSQLWGLNNPTTGIRAPQAWDFHTGSSSFPVGTIDTGIQWYHPDLAANVWTNPGEIAGNGLDDDSNGYIDDVHGWDFYDNDNDPDDTHGHGTHVAGTIGAVGNNGIGVAGIAWSCKIIGLRVLGDGSGTTSDVLRGMEYLIAKGVKVSNHSYGDYAWDFPMYEAMATAQNAGHIVCAAAGNDNQSFDTSPFYPAGLGFDNILAVAATNEAGNKAWFSNFGDNIHIAAPGDLILSTSKNGGTEVMSGTSMATPHVTGSVVLIWSQNPTYSYAQVINKLLIKAASRMSLIGVSSGGKFVDLENAVALLDPVVTITAPSNGASFPSGTAITFTASAIDPQDGNLSSTISWHSGLNGTFGTGASVTTTNLAVGTHQITAGVTDSTGRTGWTWISITITPPANPPAAPSGVTVIKLSAGVARVNWVDNSNNETGFDIQRETKSGKNWINQTIAGSVGANVTTFTNNAGVNTFRYRVRSKNSGGSSAWTGWVQVTL